MPVVINEMEIVMAPPASGQAQGAQPPPAAAAPPLTPREVSELLERRVRQELRLFAH